MVCIMVKVFGQPMMVNAMMVISKIIKRKDLENGLPALGSHTREIGNKINSMEKEFIYLWRVLNMKVILLMGSKKVKGL